MADLVTQHCGREVAVIEPIMWTMFFDGSSCGAGARISIILISPQGTSYEFSIPIEKTSTNNEAEYQAMLKGIKLLREVNAEVIEIFGDSQLVINQLAREYECKDYILRVYHEECLQLLRGGEFIGRWSTRKSADEEKEKATIKQIRQMESTVEAGQSTIDNRSRLNF
jgi:ribonuclease HI